MRWIKVSKPDDLVDFEEEEYIKLRKKSVSNSYVNTIINPRYNSKTKSHKWELVQILKSINNNNTYVYKDMNNTIKEIPKI